jgi:hypothetical protein
VLTEELATRLARIAIANIAREYPRHILHFVSDAAEELNEKKLHPAFFGSYDWHSAVHMHWLLMRVLRLYPVSRIAPDIADALDRHLTPENLQHELSYFAGTGGKTFERPYGWAWLLELQAEAMVQKARWSQALAPLATHLAGRFAEYVRMSPYPIRAGAHGNTAFACTLALDYARAAPDEVLEFEIRKAARRWYASDRDAPISYEPSLDDFLSPILMEATLMRRVMDDNDFFAWLQRFAPHGFGALAEPPVMTDHADPKQSHLDGLCLTRAWCFIRLGDTQAAGRLIEAALPHVSGGDYAGEHWLASFAVLALSAAALKTP